MIEQQVPVHGFIYCELVPQPFLDNTGNTFLLKLLPNQEAPPPPPMFINQGQFVTRNIIDQSQPNQILNNQNNGNHMPTFFMPKIIRKKIYLDQNAIRFKEKFYSLFTYKKRIPKDLVFNIHNNIAKKINLRKATREECRSVDKYFRNFSRYQKEIIGYLCSLPNEQRSQLQFRKDQDFSQIENDVL